MLHRCCRFASLRLLAEAWRLQSGKRIVLMLGSRWVLHLLLLMTSWCKLWGRCLLNGVFQWRILKLNFELTGHCILSRSAVWLISLASLRPIFLALCSSVTLLLRLMMSRLRIYCVSIALSSPILRLVIAISFEVAVFAGGVRALLWCSSCPAGKVVVVARLLILLGAVTITTMVPLVIKAAWALLLVGVIPLRASTLSSSVPVLVGSLHRWFLVLVSLLLALVFIVTISANWFPFIPKSSTEIPLKMRHFFTKSLIIKSFSL